MSRWANEDKLLGGEDTADTAWPCEEKGAMAVHLSQASLSVKDVDMDDSGMQNFTRSRVLATADESI
jgi:hypothetical protein